MKAAAVVTAVLLTADGARTDRRKHGAFATCGAKGASAPSGQIVNGEEATECEWRWQASLKGANGDAVCGGTLITPEWVLTAAHCADKPNFDVTLGEYNISASSSKKHVQRRQAVEVHQHPDYKGEDTTASHDYALVKLASPVEINACVGTACLPEEGQDIPAGSTCWITGWGTLETAGRQPDTLQEAAVKVISDEACVDESWYQRPQIDASMLCAQGQRSDGRIVDACQGDSGGPLVCEVGGRWTVYGATSWGSFCAWEEFPGVYARVHGVLGWIDDVLAGHAA